MKLHADPTGTWNTITAYGNGYIEINSVRHRGSLIVAPEGDIESWGVSHFDDLRIEHFAILAERAPQLVVFGSGTRLRFPHPRLTAALTAQRIGVEVMDLQAACRTYNILMAEGRKVVAALLLENMQ